MKKVTVEDNTYEIITDYRDGFDNDEFINRYTDYFKDYDYIVGDWAYDKLRLKGFNDKKNPKCTKLNNYDNLDNYLKNNCAYGCRYFVLKKVNEKI